MFAHFNKANLSSLFLYSRHKKNHPHSQRKKGTFISYYAAVIDHSQANLQPRLRIALCLPVLPSLSALTQNLMKFQIISKLFLPTHVIRDPPHFDHSSRVARHNATAIGRPTERRYCILAEWLSHIRHLNILADVPNAEFSISIWRSKDCWVMRMPEMTISKVSVCLVC